MALVSAGPLLAAWLAAPAVAWWISRPLPAGGGPLQEMHRAAVCSLGARATWHYFDTYATEAHHGLPPDNVQENIAEPVDARTSPTNMGLGLLAALAACDLGDLAPAALLERTGHALVRHAPPGAVPRAFLQLV